MEVGRKNLEKQHIIANVQLHQQPKMHQMVEQIAGPIVHNEFQDQKPPRWLITDNIWVKWGGQHVIQPSAYGVEQGGPLSLGHLPVANPYVVADGQVTLQCQFGPVGSSTHLICVAVLMFFDLGALNGLSMRWMYEIPIPTPIYVSLLRNLWPYRVDFVRLNDRLTQATLESYWQRSPSHPLVKMVQCVARMFFLPGFDPISKSFVDWRYADFLSGVPYSFGLVTLGCLASIILFVEARITCVTRSLLTFFPYFPAKPEIVCRIAIILLWAFVLGSHR